MKKGWKKAICVALAAVSVFAFAGCGSSNKAKEEAVEKEVTVYMGVVEEVSIKTSSSIGEAPRYKTNGANNMVIAAPVNREKKAATKPAITKGNSKNNNSIGFVPQ